MIYAENSTGMHRWGVYGRGPEKEKKKRLAEGVGKRETVRRKGALQKASLAVSSSVRIIR